ncbi:hypothetical protein HNP32_001415 [Brevundimonas bullata]|uniref:Uncharacterized protein n=1 Tax=Brevundimonas bullata TaxID=13160 RepID=A0A7W7INM7_9CAUL|nr:hypothetical protein [Brevundimonas bullata]MBB4797691.1 hypothetical protein [Brevundimonas bullata]MBB6382651.1 hypothetical protein [Brevundimonas bullata]
MTDLSDAREGLEAVGANVEAVQVDLATEAWIAETEDDDLMADDQDSLARVVQAEGVQGASKPQDDVAPALAPGRPMVEFSQEATRFGLIRKELRHA